MLASIARPALHRLFSFGRPGPKPFSERDPQVDLDCAGSLDHRELAVEALTQSEGRELTLALLGRDDAVSRAQAHMVSRESRGNPLFIDELVRHIQSGEPTDNWEAIGQLDLDEVLWARIQRQPEEARRLLGAVAVAGRPIRQALAFQAADFWEQAAAWHWLRFVPPA